LPLNIQKKVVYNSISRAPMENSETITKMLEKGRKDAGIGEPKPVE